MSDTCVYGDCAQPRGKAHGLCNAHYLRKSRGKPMDPPVRKHNATDSERFWSKVRKTSTCWIWTGATTHGYGVFRLSGRTIVAHRVAFMWERGPIPEGAEVDHTCFRHGCVNPAHLRLVDHQANGQNRASANSNSKSGIRGVYWVEGRGWMAAASVKDAIYRMGPFALVEDAEAAIVAWRREHMPASLNDQRKAV